MTIGQCPDCTGKVSKQAAFCPHCGHPGEDRWALSVNVRDLDMSFFNLVHLLVKITIAAIPALIIVFGISAVIGLMFYGGLHRP